MLTRMDLLLFAIQSGLELLQGLVQTGLGAIQSGNEQLQGLFPCKVYKTEQNTVGGFSQNIVPLQETFQKHAVSNKIYLHCAFFHPLSPFLCCTFMALG